MAYYRGGIVWTLISTVAVLFFLGIVAPGSSSAQDDVTALQEKLDRMAKEMEQVQEKLDALEKTNQEKEEEIEEIDDRLNKAELHTATDRLSFGVELRTRGDSLHYTDIQMAPAALTNQFFVDWDGTPTGGFNGATLPQIQGAIAANPLPPTEKYDADNDIIYTNKLRLNMKARVNSQLSFTGRLAAYKVFGDSSGVKVNQGNLGDVTMDGNTSSLPHGDTLRLERAYFNYKFNIGSLPTNFSLGRRPSTDGAPLEYLNYGLQGGSPMATIINWQFDGASYTLGLEELTGIPGAAFKLCYGVGFEGDWGNTYSLGNQQPDADDVHLFGFIADLFDDGLSSIYLNYAHAWDITDGFTGLTVMPFIASKSGDQYFFTPNTGGYVSRIQPYTEIGDWDALSLVLQTNLIERFDTDIDLFLSGSWSHTSPSRTSTNPYYEIMGMGLLNSNGELESRDGYMIYLGAVFPMPWRGRLGLEYNYGTKYWFNFTGAEDSLVGSKLAVRGHVYEAYWHQPIYKDYFFATLGTRYYDYEYTGSGNPIGKPVKIDDLSSLDALNPIVDEVWDAYLSLTFRY